MTSSLTAMDSPEEECAKSPVSRSPRPGREPYRSLPALKEVVGQEFHAPRPILPHPSSTQKIPEFFIPGVSVLYLDDLPIKTYLIGNAIYNMQQPHNETRSEHTRQTVDGRHITYTLEVVQQPEKARACGSGPRSSADRRPVDPPPVVELRVFSNGQDITMAYDATFMLYASLEVARPIAGGKMHAPPAIPVLTGVAVASAAYLERPKRAAYFIFPDLSVRHEGWYRLKFSLFECVKQEPDAESTWARSGEKDGQQLSPPARHESMANRLEVQSVPFQVYSAKKFPGLNSSTPLSVMVADQGCRVRIRRDIRQRKRRTKMNGEGDDDHSSYQGTPHATYRTLEHSRSASRNSLGSQYEGEGARRGSMDSAYNRPVLQSRQASMNNVPVMSPSLPSLIPSTSMPPPPPAYQQPPLPRLSMDNPLRQPPFLPTPRSYQPTTPTNGSGQPPFMRPITPDPEVRVAYTLPPLSSLSSLSSGIRDKYDPLTRRYNLGETNATKRSYSPHSYERDASLKAGARPDLPAPMLGPHPTPAPAGNDFIEPDMHHSQPLPTFEPRTDALSYARADGSQTCKMSRLLNPF